MNIAEILEANAASAGLIGVIIGALITLIGNLIQSFMKERNEKIAYERTRQEKIRDEKKALYAKCLKELRDVGKHFYFDDEEEAEEHENEEQEINLECESLMELEASAKVLTKLRKIISQKLQDIEIEKFEQQYNELVNTMREDVGI